MNQYSSVNPLIVELVKKYSGLTRNKFHNYFDLEDLEQEFMLAALESLESFNPRRGYIRSFLNRCLYQKMTQICRTSLSHKRRANLHKISYQPENDNRVEEIPINTLMILSILPSKLRKTAENIKYTKFKYFTDVVSKQDLALIRKILKSSSNRSNKKVKNISCIETLSVQEIAKLSEEDLFDLSNKIGETYDWIKKLVDKFDTALTSKYLEEARTEINKKGSDCGTCKLQKKSFEVNVQLPKKVSWDQKILSNIYDKFDQEMRSNIFKVTFSVGEKEYSEMTDSMRQAFEPARTINYGKIKVAIKKTGGK